MYHNNYYKAKHSDILKTYRTQNSFIKNIVFVCLSVYEDLVRMNLKVLENLIYLQKTYFQCSKLNSQA